MKRSSPLVHSSAPSSAKRARKSGGQKKSSPFASMCKRLEKFTTNHKRLPVRAPPPTKISESFSSSSSSEANQPPPVTEDESALRTWLEKHLRQHQQIIKIVSPWVNDNGKLRTKWQQQVAEVIAWRKANGRWPSNLKDKKWGKKFSDSSSSPSTEELKLAEYTTIIRHTGAGKEDGGFSKNGLKRHSVTISEDQINQLNALGFVWSSSEVRWQNQYDTLKEWLGENGRWPKTIWVNKNSKRTEEEHKEHTLSQWVSTQRQRKNGTGMKAQKTKKKITKKQIELLNLLNINWRTRETSAASDSGDGDGGSSSSSSSSSTSNKGAKKKAKTKKTASTVEL
jgi:hypothetical protein